MEQPALHRQLQDEGVPAVNQEHGASMQWGAVRLPVALAAGLQQPLTQLPSPGYDDAAVTEWPEQAPMLQPLMAPLEERRPFSAQRQCIPPPRHTDLSGTAWRSTPATVGSYPAAEVLSEQRHWLREAAANMRSTASEYPGRVGPSACSVAQEWGYREQGMHYDAAHAQAGAATLHTGQSLRSAISAAPQSYPVQQQQDFSFLRPQVQQISYAPQQSDLAPAPGSGVLSHARSPWDLAQPAAASRRAQQQTFSAQPSSAQVQRCQQEVSPPLQAPHTHARQQPTPAMGAGHLSAPVGQPRMAVCGQSVQEHPVAMTGAGYPSLQTGGGPTTAVCDRSLPAQQQPMWQTALPLQDGRVQASTAAWGPTPIGVQTAYPPLAAYPAPPSHQQPWHCQQMSRPGFALEEHQGQKIVQHGMAKHVSPVHPLLQQAHLPPPLQLYSPRHGACEWHGGPLA